MFFLQPDDSLRQAQRRCNQLAFTEDGKELRYWWPRFWPTHVGLSLLWLQSCLPVRWHWFIGYRIGDILRLLLARRRHIVAVNLRLCFPERSAAERQQLLIEVFRHSGLALLETATALWQPEHHLTQPVTIIGEEHLLTALAKGHGVLLIGFHFPMLELARRFFQRLDIPLDVVYRPHNNPVLEHAFRQAREQQANQTAIPREDLRHIFRQLRANRVVWFAPDQDHGIEHSIFAPFFGVPTATITTASRIASRSGAVPIVMSYLRDPEQQSYHLEFLPPTTAFPSRDDLQDATHLNATLETIIRRAPAQYLWLHRRFKTRPEGWENVYE